MEESFPLVSVLMVTYNSSNFIRESIESILIQNNKNFELIISDDNSTDSTWNIIKQYSNNDRIKAFKQKNNLGEYENRNFCINEASGKYIIFIDGEDLLYPNAIDFICFYISLYPHVSQLIAREWDEQIIYPKYITPREFMLFEYLDKSIIGINFTKVIFRREALLKVNIFDDKKIKGGDAYLQYKIGSNFPSVLIPAAFSWWRRRKGQASEKLLINVLNIFTEDNRFKVKILENTSYLSPAEKKIAFRNYHGNIYREIIRQTFKLHFYSVFNYFKNNLFEMTNFKAVFYKQKRNFYSRYDGENPFKD